MDGRILMPATSYVATAWEALCQMKSRKMEETPVEFQDVQIRQAVTAEEGQKVALAVLIAPDNRFNVGRQVPAPFPPRCCRWSLPAWRLHCLASSTCIPCFASIACMSMP